VRYTSTEASLLEPWPRSAATRNQSVTADFYSKVSPTRSTATENQSVNADLYSKISFICAVLLIRTSENYRLVRI
jgi:hypothetical protein